MKTIIENKYDLHVTSIVKLSDRVYKIYTEEGQFVLKYHDDPSLEIVFSRLNMLNLDLFLLPIKSRYNHFLENNENLYFSLSNYIQDEYHLNKDIRLRFYIKAIAKLHKSSAYVIKVNDGFFEESLNYLETLIENRKTELETRIQRVEKMDYHSPSDWYFLLHYDHFIKATNEAKRRLYNLEEEWKKLTSISLALTYQNFAYNHIIVKYGKIISLDKMALAPAIYDLRALFDGMHFTKLELSSLFKEYLAINPLQKHEIEWLLAFLFVPKIVRKDNDLADISALFTAVNYLHAVDEFATFIEEEVYAPQTEDQ